MNYTDRIYSTPLSPLPADLIRTQGPVKLMIGAAPGRKLSIGLLVEAQLPIGAIEISLTGPQVEDLAHQLHELINLDGEQVAALIDRLHQDDD
ncbi:hypothetical protein [Mycobacterium canetti]|uniref:hypothetical protein n=1 Tax=Mycobacterium canetti TaxID=78331 RepID=UPI0002E2D1C6|nr:hypothetical protein [Mycobacterium canetti]MBA2788283.1 hypothetical protein [Mycobacterium canetti]